MATVRVVYRGGAGVIHEPARRLRAGSTVVGRNPPDDGVSLGADGQASRHHGRLELHPETLALSVEDLDSRNGVRVNGLRTRRATLADGDVVRMGSSFMVVRFEDPTALDVPSDTLLGCAPSMRALRTAVARVARADAGVLLLGETGTGKEVVARAIHAARRETRPFVAINCTAIGDTLAESAFFGHVAGAFTGAVRDQPGLLRAAEGGTLFLDEIGDMAAALQPKLLRALETRELFPVGSVVPARFDARVIAATAVDLRSAVEQGAFRADLFARLAQIVIDLPPLRARREDVLLLLEQNLPAGLPPFDPELVEALLCHGWPYNVRELIAVATELGVWGAGSSSLTLEHTRGRVARPAARPATPDEAQPARAEIPDAAALARLLEEHQGKIAAVAKATGRSRAQVYRWLEQHGLARTGSKR